MSTLKRRLQALEGTTDTHARALPTVLPDDTPEADLDRLRAGGREAYRLTDAVELFV